VAKGDCSGAHKDPIFSIERQGSETDDHHHRPKWIRLKISTVHDHPPAPYKIEATKRSLKHFKWLGVLAYTDIAALSENVKERDDAGLFFKAVIRRKEVVTGATTFGRLCHHFHRR